MFLSLVAVVSRRCVRRTDRTMNRTTGQLAESMSYMERHYREEITLDDLASRAHYSRRHYTRLFRDCFVPPRLPISTGSGCGRPALC